MNRLPAAHGRSIKGKALLKTFLSQLVGRNREVSLRPAEVCEAKVDSSDLALTTQSKNFTRRELSFGHL
jgi:hypothetical protein